MGTNDNYQNPWYKVKLIIDTIKRKEEKIFLEKSIKIRWYSYKNSKHPEDGNLLNLRETNECHGYILIVYTMSSKVRNGMIIVKTVVPDEISFRHSILSC